MPVWLVFLLMATLLWVLYAVTTVPDKEKLEAMYAWGAIVLIMASFGGMIYYLWTVQ